MRYLLSILFVIFSLAATAQTTYYIDPAGTDGVEVSGDISHPWKTLSYACTRARTIGDVIHVNEGTYNEASQSNLYPGVDIVGEGIGVSVILATTNLNPLIRLYSAVANTNGNQSIRYLTIDGNNLLCNTAIWTVNRSNVIIENVTVRDFYEFGVLFYGSSSGFSLNNIVRNDSIINCSAYTDWGRGCLAFGWQKDFLIENNHIEQTGRTTPGGVRLDGYGIKNMQSGYCAGTIIRNNTVKVEPRTSSAFVFAVELWNSYGGLLVEGNTFSGAFDMGGEFWNDSQGYGYAVKIVDNLFGWDELYPTYHYGIDIETNMTGGTLIARNTFRNLYNAISLYTYHDDNDLIADVDMQYNLFYNIGVADGITGGNAIRLHHRVAGEFRDIDIRNNTIDESGVGRSTSGIYVNTLSAINNLNIQNNIITNFDNALYFTGGTTITGFRNENNLLYGNGNNNDLRNAGVTFVSPVTQFNLKVNPLFVGGSPYSWDIQSASPARDSGKDLSLSYDIDSTTVPYNGVPDIGAYEFSEGNIPDPAIDPTVVSTTRPYWTSPTTATSGGYVTDDGGGTVTARGICWSTSNNPTIADSHTSNGSGTGAYTSFMTGLNDDLLYYVRAYATNEAGTSYGAQLTFRSSQVIRNKEVVVIHNGKIINIQ